MRRWMVGLAAVLLEFVPLGQAQSFDVTEVAPGVFAAIGKPGAYSNGAFMVNRDEVVVVDTHLRPRQARYQAALRPDMCNTLF